MTDNVLHINCSIHGESMGDVVHLIMWALMKEEAGTPLDDLKFHRFWYKIEAYDMKQAAKDFKRLLHAFGLTVEVTQIEDPESPHQCTRDSAAERAMEGTPFIWHYYCTAELADLARHGCREFQGIALTLLEKAIKRMKGSIDLQDLHIRSRVAINALKKRLGADWPNKVIFYHQRKAGNNATQNADHCFDEFINKYPNMYYQDITSYFGKGNSLEAKIQYMWTAIQLVREAGLKKLWVVASTSGWTDLLAFIGFHVTNFHRFADKRTNSDIRLLCQASFMAIHRYSDLRTLTLNARDEELGCISGKLNWNVEEQLLKTYFKRGNVIVPDRFADPEGSCAAQEFFATFFETLSEQRYQPEALEQRQAEEERAQLLRELNVEFLSTQKQNSAVYITYKDEDDKQHTQSLSTFNRSDVEPILRDIVHAAEDQRHYQERTDDDRLVDLNKGVIREYKKGRGLAVYFHNGTEIVIVGKTVFMRSRYGRLLGNML